MSGIKETYRFCVRDVQVNDDGVIINTSIIADFQEKFMFIEQHRGGHYHKIELNHEELEKVIKSYLIYLRERSSFNE